MKNIRFYTIAVLFDKQPTPKGSCCLYVDIWYLTFDIGSHVISCLRESWSILQWHHIECNNNKGSLSCGNKSRHAQLFLGSASRPTLGLKINTGRADKLFMHTHGAVHSLWRHRFIHPLHMHPYTQCRSLQNNS